MIVVLDTNIIISALLKDSVTRKIIFKSDHTFLFPENIFQEIRKYKKEILAKSGLNEEEYSELITKILKYVHIVPEELISFKKEEAHHLVKNIDLNDILFFATALSFKDSVIWSEDKKLKRQNKIKVFNTKEMIGIY